MVEVKDGLMKVGEFSKLTGLPVSTLHFYERKGLISPGRDSSGHREYCERDLAWVEFIERLKDTGMPLAKIREYADLRALGDGTLADRMEMLVAHRDDVVKEIAHWQDNLGHLDLKIEYYEREISKRDGSR